MAAIRTAITRRTDLRAMALAPRCTKLGWVGRVNGGPFWKASALRRRGESRRVSQGVREETIRISFTQRGSARRFSVHALAGVGCVQQATATTGRGGHRTHVPRVFANRSVAPRVRMRNKGEYKCLPSRCLHAARPSKITHSERDLHMFYMFPLHKARRT
jgi:hypothetical protein